MRAPPRWPLEVLRAVVARAAGVAKADAVEAHAEAERRLQAEESARDSLRLHRGAWQDAARRGPGAAPLAATLAVGAGFAARSAREEGRLAAMLAQRQAEHAAACAEAERRRAVYGEALAALRGLDGRRQAWRAARARDRARAEEEANDELVSARWRGGS